MRFILLGEVAAMLASLAVLARLVIWTLKAARRRERRKAGKSSA